MQSGNRLRQALAKATRQLRREADLRHQYQYLFALGEGGVGECQIDFGFATAGNPV